MQNEKTNWVTQKRKADADIETTTKSCCGFSPLCEKIRKFVPKSLIHFQLHAGLLKYLGTVLDLKMRKQIGLLKNE